MTGLAGLALCVVALAGCGDDEPAGSDASATDEAATTEPPPVFPTDNNSASESGPGGAGGAACDLLSAADVEQVLDIEGVSAEGEAGAPCKYDAEGSLMVSLTVLAYEQDVSVDQLMASTLGPFDDVEEVSDLGDGAAYVADVPTGPELMVWAGSDSTESGKPTLLSLSLGADVPTADSAEGRQQLEELAGIAIENV